MVVYRELNRKLEMYSMKDTTRRVIEDSIINRMTQELENCFQKTDIDFQGEVIE